MDSFMMPNYGMTYPIIGDILLYRVKPGENIYNIAKEFNTQVAWIKCLNNLNALMVIYPHQQLLIPVVYTQPKPTQPEPIQPQPPTPIQPRSTSDGYDLYF